MNVQLMQMVQVKKPDALEIPKAATKNDSFGTMFNKAVNQKPLANQQTNKTTQKEGPAALKTTSLKELLDLLGIEQVDGLLLIDEQLVAVEDLLQDLPILLGALGMEEEQLQQIVQALTGEEIEARDAWDLLTLLAANDTNVQAQLSTMLQGEHDVTPKEANKFLELLKFVQMATKEVDLTSMQEAKVQPLTNLLQSLVTTMTKPTEAEVKPALPFEHLLAQTKSEIKPTGQEAVTTNTVQTRPNTFQVTLPQTQPAQSEALLKEMQAIINKAQISQNQGITRLMIKLYPENLGTLRIELVQQNGMLSARMLASTASGREMIDNQLHQLKQAFVQQGLQVERIDVGQTLQDTDRNNREQQGFFNQFFKRQQEEQQQDKKGTKEQQSFEEFLENEEV